MIQNFLSRHRDILTVVAIVAVIKILLFGWMWLHAPQSSLLDHWDERVYKTISMSAYNKIPEMAEDYWAFLSHFPPAYPLAIFLVSLLFFSVSLSGFFVSFVSILAALVFLYKLVLFDYNNKQQALLAVLFFSLFPTSYFSISIYSESLFLLFTLASFYCLRKERFWWSSLCAGGAVLTRSIGIVLIPVYAVYFCVHLFKKKKVSLSHFSLFLAPIIAFMTYWGMNKFYFGDYFYFLNETVSFNKWRQFAIPFQETYYDFLETFQNSNFFSEQFMTSQGWNALFVIFGLVITVWGIKKIRWEYTLYSLSSLILFSSISWGISNPRFVFVLFPIYITLSFIKIEIVRDMLLGIFLMLLLYFSYLFASGAWAF